MLTHCSKLDVVKIRHKLYVMCTVGDIKYRHDSARNKFRACD